MLINFGKQSRDWAIIILGESFIYFIQNNFLCVPDITNIMSILKVFQIDKLQDHF